MGGVTLRAKPNIFQYDNYRRYLDDCLSYMSTQLNRSSRNLAEQAGFKSPNYINLIVQGKRNLSHKSSRRLAEAFDLDPSETKFFLSLVKLNQSKNSEEKGLQLVKVLKNRKFAREFPLRVAAANYYSKWYYIPVRELIALGNFREDHQWIANKLNGCVEEREVEEAIQQLLALGLIMRDPEGRLQQVDKNVIPEDSISSLALKEFHRRMIDAGKESMDNQVAQQREISSVTIPINGPMTQEMKMLIVEFRRKMLALATKCENPDRIYQMNIQFFSLTNNDEEPS